MKMNFFFNGYFWGILLILWGLSLVLKAFFPNLRFPIGTIFVSICIIVFGVQLLVGGFGNKRSFSERRAKHGFSQHQRSGFQEELNVVFSSDTLNLSSIDVTENDRFVEVNAVFGRAILYVGSDIPVRLETDAVFGRIHKDSRLRFATKSETALVVKAEAVFGSIDIIVLDK
jgi:predicted membrane protein